MHQLASSIFTFLLSPLHWIVLFLIAGFLFKKKRVRLICRICALCIFLVFGNPLLLNWYANRWQPSKGVIDPSKHYSCGIVLGGFVSKDAEENGYFNGSADRFIQVLKLFKVGEIENILVSGGNSKGDDNSFREAVFVKNELITMGVPDSVIFTEDRSANTMENAIHSKQILDSVNLRPPYLLISSANHLPRASMLFRKGGVQTEPFACNFVAGRTAFSFPGLIPHLWVLTSWESFLKEAAGYFWYR